MRLPPVTRIQDHPRWKGGRSILPNGYVRVRTGDGRYQYEHRVVAEAMLGRKLATREQVHHRNGDKADNRPENLLVLGIREHALLHEEHHFGPVVGRWAADYDACLMCGLTTRKHEGRGYCRKCYNSAAGRRIRKALAHSA